MKPPVFRDPEWRTPEERGMVEIVRTIEIVTPMFGGGVALNSDEAKRFVKDADKVTVLRTASLVGQVRFWWRAIFGARMESLATMRAAEEILFGAASTPGNVCLRLEGGQDLRLEPLQVWDSKQSASGKWNPAVRAGCENLAYGAFALQAKAGTDTAQQSGVLLSVRGRCQAVWSVPRSIGALQLLGVRDDGAAQVALSVDAWLLLGGIGGRTRRGFGAVHCAESPDLGRFREQLSQLAVAVGGPIGGVPMLKAEGVIAVGDFDSPQQAHSAALGAMKRFRQGVGFGRNAGATPNRPGRSFWPEAHAIRELTGERNPIHAVSMHTPAVKKFPRAMFGMPIIFHFQGGGDPRDTQLVPVGRSRMASPLILRPIDLGGGRWAAGCVFLSDTSRANLVVELKGSRASYTADWQLSPGEARAIGTAAPKLGIESSRTAHRAFIEFFKKNV